MKRFRGPAASAQQKPTKEEEKAAQLEEDIAQKVVFDAAAKLEQEEGSLFHGDEIEEKIASAVDTGITDELRRRKADVASTS